ncbi:MULTISPECIES: hypothetical protein [unclassified Pseudomonas]|uniref:hypothetical protein n=1 Tax=unclassified Pseudomonas TaxID=196821 RepID=UPI000A1E5826|nr:MULTISPECIES: hypothetical protein [unclassified Pseudomonas]
MPYIVINSSNFYDPANLVEHPTEADADAAARELLKAQPTAIVRTAQVIKRYSAQVQITAEEAQDVLPEAVVAEEAAQ